MRLVFWQDCLSPHQLPYIQELSNDDRVDEVILLAGESLSDERREMGWKTSSLYDKITSVYIQPDISIIEVILKEKCDTSIHLFVGIRGFAFVYRAFRASLKYDVKRGIITERPNTYTLGLANGKPLWLHKFRFLIQDSKYIPYIDYIFAIGEECADYYSSISKNWRVIPFTYCTLAAIAVNSKKKELIVFVGSLSKRKNARLLIKAASLRSGIGISLVGDGPQREILEQLCMKLSLQNIHFMGYQMNSDIPAIMSSHEVLVLPSIYDGWGAVVNEALMNGLFVICSDRCGAKDLLHNKELGMVFRSGDSNDLADCLQYIEENIDDIRKNRVYRMNWAKEHISGDVIARYMIDCLNDQNVTPPWRL